MRFIRVRTLLLKNASPKLACIEKQPHTALSISTGLTERLMEHSL